MDTIAPTGLWFVFIAAVPAALFVDFVVLKKQGAHEVGVKQALHWSIVWVMTSFAFNGLFWWAVAQDHGSAGAHEKSLAVDNIFVFLLGAAAGRSARVRGGSRSPPQQPICG